LRKQENKTIKQ